MPIKLKLDEIQEWIKWNPRFTEDDHNLKILIDSPDVIDSTEKLTEFINKDAAKFHWLAEKPKEPESHKDNRLNHSNKKDEEAKAAEKTKFDRDEKTKKAREVLYLAACREFYGLQGSANALGRVNHSETQSLRRAAAASMLVNFPEFSNQIKAEFGDFLK